MAEEWDLFAIVRSCQSTTSTVTTAATNTNTISPPQQHTTTSSSFAACTSTSTSVKEEEYDPFSFPNLLQPITNEFQELNELLTPFNPISNTSGVGINPNSPDFAGCIGQQHSIWPHQNLVPQASTSGFNTFHDQQQQQNQASHSSSGPDTQPQTPRSRKRKSQQNKRVCHVTTDNLSADMWAWRKYGQKPIKGSPYPRNYYKCSSSKSCSARKQVERSNSDPNMFIITFTGDHNHPKPTHRNSLAGSTRSKPSTAPVNQGSPSFQATAAASAVSSPPHSAAEAAAELPENEEMEPDSPDLETETDVDAGGDMEPGLNLGPFQPSSSDIRFNPG